MNTLLDALIAELEFEELYEGDVGLIEENVSEYDYLPNETQAEAGSTMRSELEQEGPGIATSCGGQPVRTTLHVAGQYASIASQHLNMLSSLPDNQAKTRWNDGPEKLWFGAFRKNRMISIKNRMWKIAQLLKDPLLVIKCDWSKPYFGKASPGIKDIKIGLAWRDAPASHIDKVQTIIHEAAHIRGAVLGGELRKKYGIPDALDRADKYPGVAIRTAENIGYYVVCRASKYGGCP